MFRSADVPVRGMPRLYTLLGRVAPSRRADTMAEWLEGYYRVLPTLIDQGSHFIPSGRGHTTGARTAATSGLIFAVANAPSTTLFRSSLRISILTGSVL